MKKIALITGGTRGIGAGVAEQLAHSGYDLVLCGRRTENDVLNALDALRASGQQVHYIQADVGSKTARDHLVATCKERVAHVNVLINNAGMAPRERTTILDASEESFEEVLKVNLQGPYFITQAIARWMIEKKSSQPNFTGCVVNINSISSTVASISRGEYCISKAGLSMATRLWAVALAEFDIPVYEIQPGITATDMTAGVKAHYDRLIEEGLLLQPRWGTPEDIGKAVVALVQGHIPYATGQVLVQDGGLTLNRL